MPDFNKLRAGKARVKVVEPEEVFRRLPKPPGINDLYQSQAEVLRAWYARRAERDLVIKLHTGGGKTLVGLLIAQSTLNEMGEPVLYLTPTVQLMNQALAKAVEYGLPAVPYAKGAQPLPPKFINGQAVLVATYNALFNGISKFGVSGSAEPPVKVGAIILDDAHVAFGVIRDQFTLKVESTLTDIYGQLTAMFRRAFQQVDRVGTFDDVVSGAERMVLEIPYWAWHEKKDSVREIVKSRATEHRYVWPFLRDRLDICHAFISSSGFSITPFVPPVEAIPTFVEAPRRIYMSATIADDSAIVRTFGASEEAVSQPLTSKSLAGVSERMILVPELMPFPLEINALVKKLGASLAKMKKGVVILAPSTAAAQQWEGAAALPVGPDVETAVSELQSGSSFGPTVLANRYDGIDLPGDSCRLLVMAGLPRGTSDYELYRGSALMGGRSILSDLSQRIEQGIGRGARGAGDHCVVLLVGRDLIGWISKEANFKFLTASTRAQVLMGTEISKATTDLDDLRATILKCLNRDKAWMEYHAGQLADIITTLKPTTDRIREAVTERKAVSLFADGHREKAISKLTEFAGEHASDDLTRGWFEQLAARFAFIWGNTDLARSLQAAAYAHNRNLLRPTVLPPYHPRGGPGEQSIAIAALLSEYRERRGFLRVFEEAVAFLVATATSNQFEQALCELGSMLGFNSERPEHSGYPGCDVLWLLPDKTGCVMEAKSRKGKGPFTKRDHGQLLVAQEWFTLAYPDYRAIPVSVHPTRRATRNSVSSGSRVLTYAALQELVGCARSFFGSLCESQVADKELGMVISSALSESDLRSDRIAAKYFADFEEA